jgi:hypothetical protein
MRSREGPITTWPSGHLGMQGDDAGQVSGRLAGLGSQVQPLAFRALWRCLNDCRILGAGAMGGSSPAACWAAAGILRTRACRTRRSGAARSKGPEGAACRLRLRPQVDVVVVAVKPGDVSAPLVSARCHHLSQVVLSLAAGVPPHRSKRLSSGAGGPGYAEHPAQIACLSAIAPGTPVLAVAQARGAGRRWSDDRPDESLLMR